MSRFATAISAAVKSKAAAVVAGVLLVGGTGTVALAATHGDIGPVHLASQHNENDQGENENGDHPHTISIEGVLTTVNGCPSSVSSIVVTKASESDEHDEKDTDDKTTGSKTPVATEKPEATRAPSATKTAGTGERPEGTEKPEATKPAGTMTLNVTLNSKTKVNGLVKTATGLCGKTGRKVEVQAEKNSSGQLVAWKVTLQGADNEQDGQSKSATPGAHSTPSSRD